MNKMCINTRSRESQPSVPLLCSLRILHYFLVIVPLSYASFSAAMPGAGLAPPRYETIDFYGVNMTNGQVSIGVETVSIGGNMGLSHSISGYTNGFSVRGYDGYYDKYAGKASWVKLGENLNIDGTTYALVSVMRVHALGDSADFRVVSNAYQALGDKRQTLEISADGRYLEWTKVDGTVVRFRRPYSPTLSSSATFEEMTYPNGFNIKVNYIRSVTTNTGYQIKYDYIDDSRPLDIEKRGRVFGQNTNVPQANSLLWSRNNPKYVRGINNTVEYCSNAIMEPCQLSKRWPMATFNWPAGMPRAIYIDSSVFSVVDMKGAESELHFESFDLVFDELGRKKTASFEPSNTKLSPRLVAFKRAGATSITSRFSYVNQFKFLQGDPRAVGLGVYVIGDTNGRTRRASRMGASDSFRYDEPSPIAPGSAPIRWQGSGMIVSTHQTIPTAINDLQSQKYGSMVFHADYANRVRSSRNRSGVDTKYFYNSRGNLERIVYEEGDAKQVVKRQGFPSSCSNRKTCNLPLWVEDGQGNRTVYTYHPQSGQVASVTSSPDQNNKVAQTRFFYSHLQGYKLNSSGSKVVAGSRIWMKTREAFCRSSNYVGSSCQTSGDEVITRYEYDSDNLNLTGVVVEADGKKLRTCYEYDFYGNRIGETAPNAKLTSCPRS